MRQEKNEIKKMVLMGVRTLDLSLLQRVSYHWTSYCFYYDDLKQAK